MKNKKRPILLLLSLLILPYFVATPCGYFPPVYRGYTLIHPEILGKQLGKPFLFSEVYYSYDYDFRFDGEVDEMKQNIEEWKEYFDGKPSEKDIRQLIYQATIGDLELLQKRKTNQRISIPLRYKLNTLITYLEKGRHPDFLPYLMYAKQCEPAVSNPHTYNWETEEKESTEAGKKKPELIRTGKENYAKAKDRFIKLRYAFQLVRLAHYFDGSAVDAYEKYVKPLKSVPSIMQYWAMAHKAGELVTSKEISKKAEGNYLFSKVLASNNFSNGNQYRSMNIDSEEMWQAVLKRCKNNKERANLYYIRALDKYSKALEEMEAIYQFHPKSPFLEVLLVRELQKLETSILEDKFEGFEKLEEGFKTIPKAEAKAYLQQIKPFVKKVVVEQKVVRLPLWEAADGYLEFLDDNHAAAQDVLAKAAQKVYGKGLMNDQIEIFQFGLLLSLTDTVKHWMEDKLGDLLLENQMIQNPMKFGEVAHYNSKIDEWIVGDDWFFEYQEHNYIFEKMADLYYKQGELGKAYLCLYSIEGLKLYPHSQTAKAVLELFDKKNKSGFETYLIDKENIKKRREIIEILGKSYLMEDQLYAAYAAFSMIPKYDMEIKSPFRSMTHTHEATVMDSSQYSHLKLIEKVIGLRNLTKTYSPKKPVANLQLGNYYYNTSWYAHAWQARDYFKSVNSYEDLEHPLEYVYDFIDHGARGNRDVYNLPKVTAFYKKALKSNNDELKVEATFMLAKCERRKYRDENYSYYGYEEKNAPPKDYLKTYQQIEDDFTDTDYYKMVIKDCADYSAYVNQ
ncbi:MAG: hypothetical protein ACI9XO_003510 [Paraglaciecola sp.]|jgi:hypothetical protein